MSQQIFLIKNQSQYLQKLQASLDMFLSEHYPEPQPSILIEDSSVEDLYTKSINYIASTTAFHMSLSVIEFIASLTGLIDTNDLVVDVGTCSGFTGLSIALAGKRDVTLYDFDGIGGEFIKYFIEQEGLTDCRFLPYSPENDKRKKYDWAIALDVLEHSGNQLAFVRWLTNLGRNVAMTYPMSVSFYPPYMSPIDDWVDDEIIVGVIGARYNILENYATNGRRFLIFSTQE